MYSSLSRHLALGIWLNTHPTYNLPTRIQPWIDPLPLCLWTGCKFDKISWMSYELFVDFWPHLAIIIRYIHRRLPIWKCILTVRGDFCGLNLNESSELSRNLFDRMMRCFCIYTWTIFLASLHSFLFTISSTHHRHFEPREFFLQLYLSDSARRVISTTVFPVILIIFCEFIIFCFVILN